MQFFEKARILDRILDAVAKNRAMVAEEKGARLGYMGHITHIANLVSSIATRRPDLVNSLKDYIDDIDWQHYVATELADTNVQNSKMLGGQRPMTNPSLESDDDDLRINEAPVSFLP